MTKDTVLESTTGLPRRSFLVGAAVIPAAFAAPSHAMPAPQGEISAKVKRLAKEMSAALDQLASEAGDTEWQLVMAREDETGAQSSVVRLMGHEGQASNRRQFSETVWVLE